MKECLKNFKCFEQYFKTSIDFIKYDIEKNGNKNFNDDYINKLINYRNELIDEFVGDEYDAPIRVKKAGSKKHKILNNLDNSNNFGNVWETICSNYFKTFHKEITCWPKGPDEFPDFETFEFVGDFKTIKVDPFKTAPNYVQEGGGTDLYYYENSKENKDLNKYRENFKDDINIYKNTGKLSRHLSALIVAAVYFDKYDENTGVKKHIICNIICLPAICLIKHGKDGIIKLRNGKVLISFNKYNLNLIKSLMN